MKFLGKIETFTARRAAHLSGLTPTMLDYLCREEFVTPSGNLSRGRGVPRLFTFQDLVILKVIRRLLSSGIEVKRLSKGLRAMRDRLGAAMLEDVRFFVTDGHEVFISADGALEALTEKGQLSFAFLIDLHVCQRELNEAQTSEASAVGAGGS